MRFYVFEDDILVETDERLFEMQSEETYVEFEVDLTEENAFEPVETWKYRIVSDNLPDWYSAKPDYYLNAFKDVLSIWWHLQTITNEGVATNNIYRNYVCKADGLHYRNAVFFVQDCDYPITFTDCIVYAKNSRNLRFKGESVVTVLDNCDIFTTDRTLAYIRGNSRVTATGSCTIVMSHNSIGIIKGNCFVTAYDNSKLELRENSFADVYNNVSVKAYNFSDVRVYDDAEVILHDHSTAWGYGEGVIQAFGDSKVYVEDFNTVYGYNNSMINISSPCLLDIRGNCIAILHGGFPLKDVYVQDNAIILDKDNVCIANSAVGNRAISIYCK